MSIQKIDHTFSESDLSELTTFFPDYVKLVADIDKNILYGGSEFHADIEKILLDQGSIQASLWGGGVHTKTKKIDCLAIINIRPGINPDPNILDSKIRDKFLKIVKLYFPDYNYG
ncbi:MAG: DUF5674 family protein [Candidatus Shapirobacteria bacterium]|jgi:hypothetical protein